MANDIKLQSPEGTHPVDENLRPLFIGEKQSAIETAQHGNGAKINGGLEVTGDMGTIKAKQITFSDTLTLDGGETIQLTNNGALGVSLVSSADNTALLIFAEPGDPDYVGISVSENGGLALSTNDIAGAEADFAINADGYVDINSASGEAIILDAGGDITLDAGGGDVTVLQADVTIPADKKVIFGDAGEHIVGDGTNLDIVSSARITNTSGGAYKVDSGAGVILDSATGLFNMAYAGTEFSATNSAYAGMILGYTRLQGDLTSQNSYEIQNAMTVEDDTHQISFKTPPSELVEIEATFLINRTSGTDTKICAGLSDQSATEGYNSLGIEYEYDSIGVSFSDDEIDDGVVVVKWTVIADDLAAIGQANTLYIGFSTGGATKTAYIAYGVRSSHGICDHPFIIKATALPAGIYAG